MIPKMFQLSAALTLTAAAFTAQPASAHSAHEVKHMLRNWGFTQIEVFDANLPKYQFEACKRGHRYHLHADYYGEITEKREIGYCDDDSQRYSGRRYEDYRDRYER